jgi:tetratricopeptide (TPR) repeat protein
VDKLEHAAKDYEKASEIEPSNVNNLYNAGKTNYRIQNYEKALIYLTEAVTLDNGNFQAYQFKCFTHIKLKDFQNALIAIDNALAIEKTDMCHYTRGVANDSLKIYQQAISDYKISVGLNPDFEKAFYALTKAYINNNELELAMENAELSVQNFPSSGDAYEARSLVFHAKKDYPSAINDLSKLETLVDDTKSVLLTRGIYYFEYRQFQNAKSDFSRLISIDPSFTEALYWRARANEEMMEKEEATIDYMAFLNLSKASDTNAGYRIDAKNRAYELNREEVAPAVAIDTPLVIHETKLAVLNNADRLLIEGVIKDASKIASFSINGTEVVVSETKSFSHSINIVGVSLVSLNIKDEYNNESKIKYDLMNMEADAPIVRITTPYAGDNNEIYLDSDDANLYIEGFINDESTIKSVYIDDVRASYNDTELNPQYAATVNIENKDAVTVKAVDAFDNEIVTTFKLNREGALIAESNPMGKTWVVFIENSHYETFASLDGPIKDVSTMKSALSSYEIHNFIHKKDMTKKEMQRFFSIELRDQVKKNNVNSLLVWYAGHGKFINETGYWIPVNATRDDEFTYFNINALKAGMQSYSSYITHTLVVTDACESGPSFYQAMRSTNDARACDDINATKFKSSQVFSSAGAELASDDSQFTKTFARSLQYNENACIPIETIVSKVNEATATNESQKPLFGKIAGFEDENGTFFFIKK